MRRGQQRREGQRQGPAKRPEPVKAPVGPLRELVAGCEAALAALGDKPESGVVRGFWREWEARHGGRADLVLWRRLRGSAVFRGRLTDVVEPALRALRGEAVEGRWAVLAWLPAIPLEARSGALAEAVRAALRGATPGNAPLSVAWVRWLAGGWLGEDAAALREEGRALFERVSPGWKPGRALDLTALAAENWLPVELSLARRWAAAAIGRLARGGSVEKAAGWLLTGWQLRRDVRPGPAGAGAGEVEMLLDAAAALRAEGQALEAARLTALALTLARERLSDRLARRGHVAAWAVAEAGLGVDERWQARLETMPFPGDPPHSERGQEAARHFEAEAGDPGDAVLQKEVAVDPDWQVLRDAGLATQHPLPMLAWVARKAPAHAVKKQHELLAAAARLALRHGCLISAGKLLAFWPGEAARVLELARLWRASWRQMPVLRDASAWQEALAHLRAAWGRLEGEAITEEEGLFVLHETLGGDRELTLRRRLPEALLTPTSAREVALVLREDPRLLTVLEHQRAVELWEIQELARREDLKGVAWASVVGAGEPGSGRFSLLVVGAGGVWSRRVRLERGEAAAGSLGLRPALAEGAQAVTGSAAPERWLLCLDASLPRAGWEALAGAWEVPSWESAFRFLREQPLPVEPMTALSGWKSMN